MQVSRCVYSAQDFKRMVKQEKIKIVFHSQSLMPLQIELGLQPG